MTPCNIPRYIRARTPVAGDPVLFEFNASGTQRLIYQAYWIIGHFSRFARPGARVLFTNGTRGVASSSRDYDAVRGYAVGGSSGVNNTGLPLLAVGFESPSGGSVSVVVANPSAAAVQLKLRDADADAGAATLVTLPSMSIATYSWDL